MYIAKQFRYEFSVSTKHYLYSYTCINENYNITVRILSICIKKQRHLLIGCLHVVGDIIVVLCDFSAYHCERQWLRTKRYLAFRQAELPRNVILKYLIKQLSNTTW